MLNVKLNLGRWLASALDNEAVQLVPEKRSEIDVGKSGLAEIEKLILSTIEKI